MYFCSSMSLTITFNCSYACATLHLLAENLCYNFHALNIKIFIILGVLYQVLILKIIIIILGYCSDPDRLTTDHQGVRDPHTSSPGQTSTCTAPSSVSAMAFWPALCHGDPLAAG